MICNVRGTAHLDIDIKEMTHTVYGRSIYVSRTFQESLLFGCHAYLLLWTSISVNMSVIGRYNKILLIYFLHYFKQ